MPKSEKTNVNILHQEKLIAQKKREIEAKLERQAKRSHLASKQASQASEYVGLPCSYLSDRLGAMGRQLPV